ncbi:MAG: 2-phosphosulfolactate phosphatase, partial [Pseudonocardiales bacterium]|nr:2-phosphosulfolactate phosphatase [Pseudonocardiales bacterium]
FAASEFTRYRASVYTHAREHGQHVLSFTTTLTVAADRNTRVFPFRVDDRQAAATLAAARKATLAVRRSNAGPGQVSLSPRSVRAAPGPLDRLVLPSLNGSTISFQLAETGSGGRRAGQQFGGTGTPRWRLRILLSRPRWTVRRGRVRATAHRSGPPRTRPNLCAAAPRCVPSAWGCVRWPGAVCRRPGAVGRCSVSGLGSPSPGAREPSDLGPARSRTPAWCAARSPPAGLLGTATGRCGMLQAGGFTVA